MKEQVSHPSFGVSYYLIIERSELEVQEKT